MKDKTNKEIVLELTEEHYLQMLLFANRVLDRAIESGVRIGDGDREHLLGFLTDVISKDVFNLIGMFGHGSPDQIQKAIDLHTEFLDILKKTNADRDGRNA